MNFLQEINFLGIIYNPQADAGIRDYGKKVPSHEMGLETMIDKLNKMMIIDNNTKYDIMI